jgi:hypothetical protein
MNPASPGPLLITLGIGLILVGLLIGSGSLSWFGRLPGDIVIERETMHVYLPITSMILVSVVLSGVVYLVRRIM